MIYDKMDDAFTVPAKGLNDLPFHSFINAGLMGKSNIFANEERDRQGYTLADASKKIRKGTELLWSSNCKKAGEIKSAGDYSFVTEQSYPAAFNVDNSSEGDISKNSAMAEEIERLKRINENLKKQLNRKWRPLSADGSDVGKAGKAYFEIDDTWIDVKIKSFTSAGKRKPKAERGLYRFTFSLRDENGKPKIKNNKFVGKISYDDVSVGDNSVIVQEGWDV